MRWLLPANAMRRAGKKRSINRDLQLTRRNVIQLPERQAVTASQNFIGNGET